MHAYLIPQLRFNDFPNWQLLAQLLHYINCHLVRKLAATRGSNINSLNVIFSRQARSAESVRESARAVKEIGNKIYRWRCLATTHRLVGPPPRLQGFNTAFQFRALVTSARGTCEIQVGMIFLKYLILPHYQLF